MNREECIFGDSDISKIILDHWIISKASLEEPITKIQLKILNHKIHAIAISSLQGTYSSNHNYVEFNNLDLNDSNWIYHMINDGVYGISLEWLRMYPNIALFIDCMKWDGSIGKVYYCKGEGLE